MKKQNWIVLPVILAIVGLFMTACDNGTTSTTKPGTIDDISLIVMNGSAIEADTLPRQLPPGARVVVNATVTVSGGKPNEAFTVTVNVPPALTGKITVTEFDADSYPGAKQIDVAAAATVNMNEREWITVTVASKADAAKTAEWQFVVWGNGVSPSNNFNVKDAALSKLPNLTVSSTYPDSVPMSNRYRLTGYPVQVFRPDTSKPELDNECDQLNGMGYISGDDLEMLRNAAPNSLVRLYFSYTRHIEDNDNPGTMKEDRAGRNGWGVIKFGNDNNELKAPNNNATFYIDAEVDNALTAMAANQQTELFVNVFNATLLKMELWEQVRPITWTNRGKILEQTTGAGVTMASTGTYATEWALIAAANEGSYLRMTIDSPEFRSGWGIAQIGGTANNAFYTVNVPNQNLLTTLSNGWIRFTINMDLWDMYRLSQWTPPLTNQSIRFNVWNMSNVTGINGDTLSGTPCFVSVELFAIDD